PLDADGRIEVVASRLPGVDLGAGAPDVPRALYSRSLLAAASQGEVAELSDTTGGDAISQSIVQMHINSAICVPLMLGATTAAYLYLDSRSPSGSRLRTLRAGASAFCLALGRMASLALSNLKRIDIERRQAMFEAELSAGAEAQRWILPRRQGTFGLLAYVGESRPGRYVGGDFFDVIPLGESKLAVALGDVSGKGIPASVLMTATQGFLHAALQEHAEPGKAVSALNRFINPRRPESKFVTMWVGVFDLAAGTLTYVDAGHGYGLLLNADGTYDTLDAGGGLPVGVMDTWTYEATTVWLKPGGRALVVSDGIVEQLVNDTDPTTGEPTKRQFELDGVRDALRDTTAGADEVAALFQTLFDQAGTKDLSDDATAVLVRW
ncbi:MAG: PP2C family protein-serine/threonine phosphatase, partial [Tepidisphaeraceae bacterium]